MAKLPRTVTKTFIEKQKQRLFEMRQEILDRRNRQVSDVVTIERTADVNDFSSNHEASQNAALLLNRDDDSLRRIARALTAIQDKEYGYCEECGEDITPRRLDAMPTSTVCIDCAEAADRDPTKRSAAVGAV